MRTHMKKLHSLPLREAAFIEVMECLAVLKIPDGSDWIYEVKLDGYRAVAVNAHGTLNLYSRRRNSFNPPSRGEGDRTMALGGGRTRSDCLRGERCPIDCPMGAAVVAT